ncbi:MAG: hypothetical protein JO347_11280 [Candidatus Eremiobacteraeota bacterium]|nr:hypothetical protein [Candidatus Eremiobacteraeota bacterium]MBV8282627.1 hypothetical protein [Candidatus Eremiobacteraeota bacterium]
MTHRVLLALVLAVAVGTAGCSARSRGSSPSQTATPVPQAHIEMSGEINFLHDMDVKRCYVGKPGTKLLNGYSVSFAGDAQVEGGEVLVPGFTGDGAYDSAMVILNIAQGPGFPHGTTLEEVPQTTVAVTISNAGRAGVARFTNYRSIYGKKGDVRGGLVSGTVTWSCAEVEHAAAPQG